MSDYIYGVKSNTHSDAGWEIDWFLSDSEARKFYRDALSGYDWPEDVKLIRRALGPVVEVEEQS